ncbi:ScbR family autoregulator-binding transcription factor [Streptomyces sp. FH025]|uniref:ScbR family autoregulator-binding transcription factor n=1 Tax=Streptomyces sp. FH025 TaxID=2815937 RepID=UPI001A9DE4D0|nr:ScbR family autoregulator-binding transcription factor [Streptomyces sp. FH025]MBO1414068.1 TetR family transcriptional regulator [Streptomyces sp. FH025]
MARQLRAEQTRTTIIGAAADMFDRQGYGATSLSDIAGRGGVTKGALYFHFASKEELAVAVAAQQLDLSRRSIEKLLVRNYPGFETVVRMTFELAEQLLVEPVIRAGIRLTLEHVLPESRGCEAYGPWLEVGARQLERAVAELDVRPTIDPSACARFIVGAFTGVHLVNRASTPEIPLPRRVAEMWDVIIPGTVPPRRSGYYLALVSELAAESDAPA